MHKANVWHNDIVSFDKEYTNEDMLYIDTSDEVYNAYREDELKVIYQNGQVILNPDYAEQAEARRQEQLAKKSLTKREVFLALYADKGIIPEQIRAQITDPAALIEFDYAERYYRGNALIDLIGQKLGYTKQQLDNLFENGSF
jgi:hydroxymethylpyrimidine pyrophosphatase-like HAD family hydrolase